MSTGETPFSIMCGAEPVALIEITMPKSRVVYFDEEANEKLMDVELDLLEE